MFNPEPPDTMEQRGIVIKAFIEVIRSTSSNVIRSLMQMLGTKHDTHMRYVFHQTLVSQGAAYGILLL